MSRGRKSPASDSNSDWEKVFYNSVGTYVQIINNNLSKQFKVEPLSNHIKILGGYSFKNSEYKRQGVPIIRISDFNNEKVNLDDVVYYFESAELKKYELVEGDIIIALTGGTIAKLAIVQPGLGKLYLNQRVGKFHILHPELFEKEYFYWIARSVQSIIKSLAWGAAIPNVSPKQIETLEFPIPERKSQKGIISFLTDLKNSCIKGNTEYFDSSIENEILLLHEKQILAESLGAALGSQLNSIKKLRQQILQDAVQGKLIPQNPKDEPASVLLEKIKSEKDKLIKEGKLKKQKPLPPIKDEDIPFEIPTNWIWCRMDDISTIANGSTPKQDSFVKSGIPFLKVYNIKNQKINFDYKPQYIKEEIHLGMLKRSIAKCGDVIMNIVGPPLGKIAIIPNSFKECNFNQAIVMIRPYKVEMNKWIYFYLNEMSEINSIITKGVAGQDNISVTQSRLMKIPLPPLNEQKRIVEKIEELFKVFVELEIEVQQNQKLSQQLLQSALKEALEPK
jgi:type I restriction enzyme S subunit